MRTKKFIKNSIFAGIRFAVVFLIGLFLPKLYLNFFGSEVNGLVSSLTTFVAYFVLIESSFRGAAIFALYKPVAENDETQINKFLSKTAKTYNVFAVVYGAFTIALGVLSTFLITVDPELKPFIFLLTIILGLPTFLDFLFYEKYGIFLIVNQKDYISSLLRTIEKIINFFIVFLITPIFLKHFSVGITLVSINALFVLVFLAKIFILRRIIRKAWNFINFKEDSSEIVIPNRGYTFLNAVVGKMQSAIPIFVATFFISLNHVSIINLHSSIILGISGIITIFQSGVAAGFGELIAKKEDVILNNAFEEFQFAYYFIAVLVNVLIASLLPTFMNLYVGEVDGVNYVLPIFALLYTFATFVTDIRIPHLVILNAAGNYKERRFVNYFYSIIALPLSIIFGMIGQKYNFGLEAIMIAITLLNLVRLVEHIYISSKKVFGQKPIHEIKMITISFLLFMILIFPNYIKVDYFLLVIDSYLKWLLYAIVLGAASLFLITPTFILLDYKIFKRILKRLFPKKISNIKSIK